jgi:ABC-type multidrug transport system ATPase subunit
MPAEIMIACEDLTKRFGHFTAVDRVSFSVAKGSIFGFLGPNGSGKSTVIRMLCGILAPSDGQARIAGFDVARQSDELKDLIGYMSQKFSLYDELSVTENLLFYGRLYGFRGAALRQRMDELIALLAEGESLDFLELFASQQTKADMIVTFLALLELIRPKLVKVYQRGMFGPIRVFRPVGPEAGAAPSP